MYCFDFNAILTKSMKNSIAKELIGDFDTLYGQFKYTGITPKVHILDNEAYKAMNVNSRAQKSTIQLVPPNMHIRNTTELHIQTFKANLIAGICGTN